MSFDASHTVAVEVFGVQKQQNAAQMVHTCGRHGSIGRYCMYATAITVWGNTI